MGMYTLAESLRRANFDQCGERMSVNILEDVVSLEIPVVSVIVTVYKRTQYLHIALQSALQQTFNSFEIIVTDDSNSDSIKAISDSFQDSKVRYRSNFPTLGVALNLQVAIEEARGRYIAILNDDDYWEPEFLEALVTPLEQDTNRILAYSDHWIMHEDGQVDIIGSNNNSVLYGRSSMSEGDVANLEELVLLKNGVPLAMASIFRKDVLDLDQLVKDVSGAYDFWISCLLASTRRPAYYVSRRLTRYRIHQAMETARKAPDKNEHMVFIYRKIISLNLFPTRIELISKKLSRALYQVGKDKLIFGIALEAKYFFMESLKLNVSYKAVAGTIYCYFPKFLRFGIKN